MKECFTFEPLRGRHVASNVPQRSDYVQMFAICGASPLLHMTVIEAVG